MSTTREQLSKARRGYAALRYPGDLANDALARLDDAEAKAFHIGANLQAANRQSSWRPMLAIAATVAVLASAVAILIHEGRDATKGDTLAIVVPTPPVSAEPKAAPTADEANVDFTIVPSYQSFAFNVPTSLTPASIDEYDQQARATSTTTSDTKTTGDAATVQ